MGHKNFSITRLIEIIETGGSVRTGMNIYNPQKELILKGDAVVNEADALKQMHNKGINLLPINRANSGGVWDAAGHEIFSPESCPAHSKSPEQPSGVTRAIKDIIDIKKEANKKFEKAKNCITKVLSDISETGGEFDFGQVEETISDLLDFMNRDESAFSHLTREIFSYDDYLYNHATNVCTIGTPVLKRFLENFGDETGCTYAHKLREISIGYFLHDIGKILVPDEILNKKEPLTDQEFEIIKTHSYELGLKVYEKNKLSDRFILDSAEFHHAAVYDDEDRCYPAMDSPQRLPAYVKICKMADIYDAMTSKRCYKEAYNPINVVNDLYKQYANKNRELQQVLHTFVSVVGIYPPGSIITLTNGQMAYVISAQGPLVIPFTDKIGDPLRKMDDPVDISDQADHRDQIKINHTRSMVSPRQVYERLPTDLRDLIYS